jgi:hypothetical protein
MSQSRVLVLLAGAALSIGAPALAQNAGLAQSNVNVAELNADSQTRTSLLQGGGGTAGRDDNGFFISDGAGNNTLYFGGTIQFRYTMSFRDDDSVGDQNDFTHGFSNNTVRLRSFGNVWSKDYIYKLVGNFGSEGGFELQDAYAGYVYGEGFTILAGQMNAPHLWETLVDDEFQLASGRSVVGTYFSGGRTQGVAVQYQSDAFRVIGAFSDGAGAANTYYNSSTEADYSITLRVDVAVAGTDWARFNDFTSWRSQEEFAGRVGGSIHWQDGGETGGTNDVQILRYSLDAQFEGGGWNAFIAGMGENVDAGGSDFDTFGLLAQGGIFLADQFELFGRVEAIFWDDDAVGSGQDDNWFLTVGGNYYISPDSHAAKFTAEVGYSFNDNLILFAPDSDPTDSIDDAGFLVGAGEDVRYLGQSDDGEIYVGLQLQTMW